MHSNPLTAFQKQLIKQIDASGGALPLDQYMALCNEHYYNSRNPLGRAGDFTTAPEVSQIFGELIGAWLVDIMDQLGSLNEFTLLECGPGQGTLMKDVLRIFSKNKILSSKTKILLLENSETLKQVQRDALADHNVSWISDINDLDTDLSTGAFFVIGNEFFDALPIKQYIFQDNDWKEYAVTHDQGRLKPIVINTTSKPDPQCTKIAKNGDVLENSPVTHQLATHLGQLIKKQGGAALFIDYGYRKTIYGDSFQAVKDHQFSNPYEIPGEADLTAHVNFEALSDSFMQNALSVYGSQTQKDFLNQLGLQHRAKALKLSATTSQKRDIDAAVKRLSDPEQMGDLFKVIAATSKPLKPAGFMT